VVCVDELEEIHRLEENSEAKVQDLLVFAEGDNTIFSNEWKTLGTDSTISPH